MTEVDAVMLEGVTLSNNPSQTTNASSSTSSSSSPSSLASLTESTVASATAATTTTTNTTPATSTTAAATKTTSNNENLESNELASSSKNNKNNNNTNNNNSDTICNSNSRKSDTDKNLSIAKTKPSSTTITKTTTTTNNDVNETDLKTQKRECTASSLSGPSTKTITTKSAEESQEKSEISVQQSPPPLPVEPMDDDGVNVGGAGYGIAGKTSNNAVGSDDIEMKDNSKKTDPEDDLKMNDDSLVTSTSTENINSNEKASNKDLFKSSNCDGRDNKITSMEIDADADAADVDGDADANVDAVGACDLVNNKESRDVVKKDKKVEKSEKCESSTLDNKLIKANAASTACPASSSSVSTDNTTEKHPENCESENNCREIVANNDENNKDDASTPSDSLKDNAITSTTPSQGSSKIASAAVAADTVTATTIASTSENTDSNQSEKNITSTDSSGAKATSTSNAKQATEVKVANNDDDDAESSTVINLTASESPGGEEDPLKTITDDDLIATSPIATNNGVANGDAEKVINDSNVVDLDDDSDDDDINNDTKKNVSSTNNSKHNNKKDDKSTSVVTNDSDVAVVIGSDSETETSSSTSKLLSQKSNNTSSKAQAPAQLQSQSPGGNDKSAKSAPPPPPPPPPPPTISDDDDDDDCVVIEDDSPPIQNNVIKRKLDNNNTNNDSQPPNKRTRTSLPGTSSVAGNLVGVPSQIGQISIKDARSLMPVSNALSGNNSTMTTLTASGKAIDGSGNIYPINIQPAGNILTTSSGPPKLTPISSVANNSNVVVGGVLQQNLMPGLSGLNINAANLLPGLTDDMFVLEAPSFIVPYIYEKPPGESLKEVVKTIETKYELSKEDLAEADKSDEFDMLTEQNKEDKDKDEKNGKKKKKRRGGEDNDDSWSEESDEDDDEDDEDEDSESGLRTKVLIKEASDDLTALKGAIKPASAVVQSTAQNANNPQVKSGQENYFESPLGKFFMDIGVGLVQEYVQSDLIRLQKRKMRKSLGKNISEYERAISALSANLEASKKKNGPFRFTMKRCEFCNFKSESALAMANHYETPHMNGPLYRCNFCTFEIRNATEIVYHMEAMHNIKARLIKPLPYHQCPNCGFEDNGKAKLARHQPVCAKKFRPEINLAPPNDWEAPAKIPRIKPRHGLVGTATAYQAMAAQAAAQKAALATIQQQQHQAAQARTMQAAALAAQNAAKQIRGRPPIINKTSTMPVRGVTNQVRPMAATNVVLPNNYQLPGNQLLQNTTPAALAVAAASSKKPMSGQPSISITPLPRQNASPQAAASSSTSRAPVQQQPAVIKPGQNPAVGNKAQFVICEICDGYIKDLEQLRNHMQWMHKVKIHPKMIYNRPPLNCQKCQFRFFTDQGLERHLLGSHGLVTSSMQEAANKYKDAGRCPVCGRMYQWKLLNHVARDHHMTLKPAHLSYKCTVCTATFGMYKQFETHVYTAHSTVAKKAMDGKKNSIPAAAAGPGPSGSSGLNAAGGLANSPNMANTTAAAQRSSLSGGAATIGAATNDSLLKPLKINDEITIIPQPAAKPRITNMESHVID